MPRFFSQNIKGDYCYITGEDALHLSKSLRAKVGEAITVCDSNGSDYHCEISEITKDSVSCKILSKEACNTEPKVKVDLYMSLPKGDKSELIIQKAVEMGINSIYFILSERCISRPDDKSWNKKCQRYQKIAVEAAKQSGRGILPQVEGVLSFKEAVAQAKESQLPIIFYERATKKLSTLLSQNPATISMIVGSEGGFTEDEVNYALENGVESLSLGSRIVRCETAPLLALGGIMYGCGEF